MSDLTPPSPPADENEVNARSLLLMRAGLVLVSLIVLGFGAMAVVSLLDGGGDDGDDTIADLLSTTTVGPTGDAGSTGNAEVDAFVDEAIVFIEELRGRAFLERPVVKLVDVDTMTRIVLDDIESDLADDPDAAEASLAFTRAIGFFEADDEFLDVYEIFVSGGVLGVYFPTSDELLVRSDGELTLLTKSTVVHELVHAFDDQHFDLDRDDAAVDGDRGWTFGAAAEGSASYVEEAWKATLSADERAALAREEGSLDPGELITLDIGFLLYQLSVYEDGRDWLARRIEVEGIGAIDDALTTPAETSEQVIEPLDAPNREPVEVPFPDVDGEVLWQGTGGQALVAAVTGLSDPLGEVSSGWGGDAITVYRNAAGAECLVWDLAADSVTDAAELLRGLDVWTDATGGEVSYAADLVRAERCS